MAAMTACLTIKPTVQLNFNITRTPNTIPIIQHKCTCKEISSPNINNGDTPNIIQKQEISSPNINNGDTPNIIQKQEQDPKFSIAFPTNYNQVFMFVKEYSLPIQAGGVVALAFIIATIFLKKSKTTLSCKLAPPLFEALKELLPKTLKPWLTLIKLIADVIEKISEVKGDDDKDEKKKEDEKIDGKEGKEKGDEEKKDDGKEE